MKAIKKLLWRPIETEATPPAPPFGLARWYPTHRHKKGGLYRLLGFGILESDRSDVAIYDDADGTVWVRDRAEFEDGRFRPVRLSPDDVPGETN